MAGESISEVLPGVGQGERITKRKEETFGDDECVHCLDLMMVIWLYGLIKI